ncbi:TENP protein, partial [Ceuthmochares aereus]|nr:TENP protein [Ceuthmochares aereus]
LSILLSLLVPAHAIRSPDCGGILTPSGLSYCKSGQLTSHTVSREGRQQHLPVRSVQIDSVKVAKLTLSLIPDTGLRLNIDVDFGITPAPSTTKQMRLSILANLQVEMNAEENLELVTSACKSTVEEKQSSGETQRSTSWKPRCFPNPTCCFPPLPELPSAWFAAQFPVTPSCQVQYHPLAAPIFSEQGITVSLRTSFKVAGVAISLPVSPEEFSMPEPASPSPSHLNLVLPKHFYTSLFSALEISGAFNMTIPVSRAKITPFPRQMSSLFQEDLPVVLRATVRSSPRVLLEEDKATLKLFLTVHVGEGVSSSQSFLSMNVDISAGLLLSVADTRMLISTAAIENIELSLAASNVGPVPDSLLEDLFLPTIRKEVPAQMNAILNEGIYLPHVFIFTYTDVIIKIRKVRNKTFQLLPSAFGLKGAQE